MSKISQKLRRFCTKQHVTLISLSALQNISLGPWSLPYHICTFSVTQTNILKNNYLGWFLRCSWLNNRKQWLGPSERQVMLCYETSQLHFCSFLVAVPRSFLHSSEVGDSFWNHYHIKASLPNKLCGNDKEIMQH